MTEGRTQPPLETVLHWHLRYNMVPPVEPKLVRTCQHAIRLVREGSGKARVKLPTGYTYKGEDTLTASEVIEHYRLEELVEKELPVFTLVRLSRDELELLQKGLQALDGEVAVFALEAKIEVLLEEMP